MEDILKHAACIPDNAGLGIGLIDRDFNDTVAKNRGEPEHLDIEGKLVELLKLEDMMGSIATD